MLMGSDFGFEINYGEVGFCNSPRLVLDMWILRVTCFLRDRQLWCIMLARKWKLWLVWAITTQTFFLIFDGITGFITSPLVPYVLFFFRFIFGLFSFVFAPHLRLAYNRKMLTSNPLSMNVVFLFQEFRVYSQCRNVMHLNNMWIYVNSSSDWVKRDWVWDF